jgi:hypothetical protein
MFVIHAADCADCARDKKRSGLNFHIEEHADVLSVSRSIWSDMIAEGSMTVQDGVSELDFKPCVKGLPYNAKPNLDIAI